MKVLVIFSVLAVASSNPITETWSLAEVYYAVSHDTRPDIMPYLQQALYEMLFGDNEVRYCNAPEWTTRAYEYRVDVETYIVLYPSPSGATKWTREEVKQSRKSFLPLFAAMAFSDTSEAARSIGKDLAVGASYMKLKELDAEGTPQDTIEVVTQAVDISLWTSTDLNQALVNPNTNPELIPYLQKAIKGMKQPHNNGAMKEIIGMVTPLGLIPNQMRNAYLLKPIKRQSLIGYDKKLLGLARQSHRLLEG